MIVAVAPAAAELPAVIVSVLVASFTDTAATAVLEDDADKFQVVPVGVAVKAVATITLVVAEALRLTAASV